MPGMNNGLKTRRSGRLRLRRPGPAMTAAPEITDRIQVELAVGGMTCAACAARVQARLNKVTGVTASVNLSTERAYISAPAMVSALDLAGVIQAAGYTAELARPAAQAGPDQDEAAPDSRPRELRHQGRGFPDHLRVRP